MRFGSLPLEESMARSGPHRGIKGKTCRLLGSCRSLAGPASKPCPMTQAIMRTSLLIHLYILEAKGGAKASAPEWESGGQRGRKKHGALFGGRGEESFICGSLPGSSCERRERRETERRETERREREREEREMREMRKR